MSNNSSTPTKNKKSWLMVLISILLVLVTIGAINYYVKNENSGKQTIVYLQRQKPKSYTLSIPAIKLEVPIKAKLTKHNMKNYICQENIDDYPGMPGNLILAGHNYLNNKLFSNLDQVKIGQKIIINHYYVYQIDKIQAVNAKYQFTHDNVARITLYTCLKENNPNYRLIIQGHLIKKAIMHETKI